MEILFDPDAHAHAVVATAAAAADLDAVRQEAGRRVERMLDGGWSGAAADAFAEAWSDWETGAAQVSGALDSIRHGLVAAGHELTASDLDAAGEVSRLSERLSP